MKSQQQAFKPPAKPINQSKDQADLYRNINAAQRALAYKRQRGGLLRIANNRQDQYAAARGPESE